jgi:hypothetical protein
MSTRRAAAGGPGRATRAAAIPLSMKKAAQGRLLLARDVLYYFFRR